MKSKSIASGAGLGYRAFDRLRAEFEQDWLTSVLVEPDCLVKLLDARSAVVFGERGSGKTALRLALIQKGRAADAPPLILDWHPTLAETALDENSVAFKYVTQMLQSGALGLLQYIARAPALYRAAPSWARETLAWFIQKYLQGNHELQLDRLTEEVGGKGVELARELLTQPPRAIFAEDAAQETVLADLTQCIQKIGISRIWVVVDGLEKWLELDMAPMAQALLALLKSLALFEIPGFELKLLAPGEFQPILLRPGALANRRLERYELTLTPNQAQQIVERRLALAFGRPQMTLLQFAAAPLEAYVREFGGVSPRGWLELLKPFVEFRLENNLDRALTAREIENIKKQNPPKLRLNLQAQQVFFHYKPIAVTPAGYKLLRQLYVHGVSSRAELWFCGIRELERVPKEGEKDYENINSWRGTLDTSLSRLRDIIEPDSDSQLYLVTKVNGMVALENFI